MFVDPMPPMQHQWQPGIGGFFDPNCGWYCQIAAIKHWAKKLRLSCPPDILPKTSLAAYSPWQEGAFLAKSNNKPTTALGWENLLTQQGPLIVAGKIGGADWGALGGPGHFVLIVGADATADTISYLDPLQGNTVKTEDFQHVLKRMTSRAYSIKVDVLRRLCDEYEDKKRRNWLDDVRRMWESTTNPSINDSDEGTPYVTNDML
jgi:Papain-like cysteine protease AvrRpt2